MSTAQITGTFVPDVREILEGGIFGLPTDHQITTASELQNMFKNWSDQVDEWDSGETELVIVFVKDGISVKLRRPIEL